MLFETGLADLVGVYATLDETNLISLLEAQKKADAVYYLKSKQKAKHWVLKPNIVKKMGLALPNLKLGGQ